MFARQLNRMRLDLSITPKGPVLIRSGRKGADPTRPDLEWVRTSLDGRPTVYLPGSSLKGVIRSHAERLLASEQIRITPTFDKDAQHRFDQKTPGDEAYRGTCPLGRTFGTLHLKGRTSVSDCIPGGHAPPGSAQREEQLKLANATEQRNGVAIDRLLGSVAGKALFDQEVVVAGRFDGSIFFHNVQLYQLALVLLALRDLDEGYAQIGSGTSRGLGWVRVHLCQLSIETRRNGGAAGQLSGIGRLQEGDDRYDLFTDDEVDLPGGIAPENHLNWERLVLSGESLDALAEAVVVGPWTSFLHQAQTRRDGWPA